MCVWFWFDWLTSQYVTETAQILLKLYTQTFYIQIKYKCAAVSKYHTFPSQIQSWKCSSKIEMNQFFKGIAHIENMLCISVEIVSNGICCSIRYQFSSDWYFVSPHVYALLHSSIASDHSLSQQNDFVLFNGGDLERATNVELCTLFFCVIRINEIVASRFRRRFPPYSQHKNDKASANLICVWLCFDFSSYTVFQSSEKLAVLFVSGVCCRLYSVSRSINWSFSPWMNVTITF